MSIIGRYDEIIEYIDYLIEHGEQDIPEVLASEFGYNIRLLADAFLFMTETTLVKYIRQRRMVYALKRRVKENLSIEQTSEIAGFSDAAAFSKACKNELSLSPSQISESRLNKYVPLFFEEIVSTQYMEQVEENTLKRNSAVAAGAISAEQFAEAKRILEVAALYGLSDEDAHLACGLSQKFNMSIDCAVSVCESINIDIQDGMREKDIEERIPRYVMCCKYNVDYGESKAIIYELAKLDVSPEEIPEEFFRIFNSDIYEKSPYLDIQNVYFMALAMQKNSWSLEELEDNLL